MIFALFAFFVPLREVEASISRKGTKKNTKAKKLFDFRQLQSQLRRPEQPGSRKHLFLFPPGISDPPCYQI